MVDPTLISSNNLMLQTQYLGNLLQTPYTTGSLGMTEPKELPSARDFYMKVLKGASTQGGSLRSMDFWVSYAKTLGCQTANTSSTERLLYDARRGFLVKLNQWDGWVPPARNR